MLCVLTSQEVAMGRETEEEEERERKYVHRERRRRETHRESGPKCLDYTGKRLWGEGQPIPGLENLVL